MKSLACSPAAAGLLRALFVRTGPDRDRFLLSAVQSTDWQSLTFTGERHRIDLRIAGPGADSLLQRFSDGIGEAEFAVPGQIVADVSVSGAAEGMPDGSLMVRIEALTISE